MSGALAITACVRDEADVLPAFLAYHRALGVDRAYLFLDRCTDGTAEILAAHDWVVAIPVARDVPAQSLEHLQLVCADDALRRARADGIAWLLHIDPDEFAWGGPLDADGAAIAAGNLRAMLARARPGTEAIVLRTLEAIPVRRPPGTPFWTMHAMVVQGALHRDVLDPATGAITHLDRRLGHDLGKSIARVDADLQAATAHRWTRRQAVFPPDPLPIREETLGHHFHYVVRDAWHWREKYRKLSIDPDVWLRGIPLEFPKLSWKRAAAWMTADEAERYYDEWIAVPADAIAAAISRGAAVVAPHVERVLREVGFAEAGAARRPPRRTARRRCQVAFVGLDAFDPGLLRAGAAGGELPTLARLLETAASAPTDPPPGFFVGALWPSACTGVGPARHGTYSWEQLVPGTYRVRRHLAGRRLARSPFWSALDAAGRRVALLDVPLSGPTPGFRGTQILEWGGHDPEEGFRTQPAGLADVIRRTIGLPPVQGNCNALRTADEHAAFRDDLVRGVTLRTRLHRWLLGRDDWDLFCTVYGESHCAGHQCWHLHDPTHVRHDPAAAARAGDPVRDVYRAIDASLGDLVTQLGPHTILVVLASHGMEPHYAPTFLLDEMLWRIDGARRGEAASGGVPPPAERTYFAVPNNQVIGAIRVNVVGREPAGRVPDRALGGVCAALAADLATFVDAETGRPIVAEVVRTRDAHRGERLDDLPDLYVRWHTDRYVRRVRSPRFGAVERDYDGVRSGDHTPEGLLLVRAPWIRPGALGRRVAIVDVAPTLAALLGVLLDGIDGRPIDELLPRDEAVGAVP